MHVMKHQKNQMRNQTACEAERLSMKNLPKTMRCALSAAMLACVLAGCSSTEPVKTPDAEAFMARWQKEAARNPGYSPSEEDLSPEPRTLMYRSAQGGAAAERALPTAPVTLALRNVPVGTVLRSLARAAGVSLVISPAVQGTVSLDVKGERWCDVFESLLASSGLRWQWQGRILQVLTIEEEQRRLSIVSLQNQFAEQRMQAEHSGELAVSVVNIRYSDAADLKKNLEKFLVRNKDAVVEIDEHNNALVIQATEPEQKRLLALIDHLDRPRAQVMLKAYIVETTKQKARELGMQWGGNLKMGREGGNQAFIKGQGIDTAGDKTGQTIGSMPLGLDYNSAANITRNSNLGLAFGRLSSNFLEAQLTMMETEGVLNILSSPSITTLDNKMAYTENGERVPYVSTNSDGDDNVQFEDAVLRLEMTPNVIDRNNLKLHVLIKKDEVDSSRAVQGNPYIVKKQTQTTVLVRSGETIVISGLSKERGSNSEAGVPGLRDLPGMKSVFGATNRSQQLEEVLIFITPVILPTRGEVGPAPARPQLSAESAAPSSGAGSPR